METPSDFIWRYRGRFIRPPGGAAALRPPAFGAEPAGERLARIRRSPHFANGVFQNPGGQTRMRPSGSGRDMARQFLDKDSRSLRAPRARSRSIPPPSPT